MTSQDINDPNNTSGSHESDSSLYDSNLNDQDYAADIYDDSDAETAGDIEPYRRSFFQKNANLLIWGGAGIFALIMGFITFKDMILPPAQNQNAAPQVVVAPETPAEPFPASPEETGVLPPAEETGMAATTAPDGSVVPPAPTASDMSPANLAPADSAPVAPEGTLPAATPDATATAPSTTPDAMPSVATPAPVVAAPVETPAPAGLPATTAAQDETAALRLEMQQQQETIAQLQEQLALAQAALADAQSKPARTALSTEQAEKPVAPKETATAKPRTARKSASASVNTARSSRYELRSVSGNAAWVASSGSNELKRVAVGDVLEGVGQITAIREQNGAWIVQGTKGQIR